MKISIDPKSALVTFSSEHMADGRDLGRLAEILGADARQVGACIELECTVGQLLENLLKRKRS